MPLATASRADSSHTDMIGSCECGNIIRPTSQKVILQALLQKANYVLDGLPPELTQWHRPTDKSREGIPGVYGTLEASQYESMRANICVTNLWIQSILFDRLAALAKPPADSPRDDTAFDQKRVWALKEGICRQLLNILYNISQANLEPNGGALVC